MKAPGRRVRREDRKAQTRRELLEAAVVVFSERGFHGSSLELIASQAGYSTGAIYWHFRGKDELFLAVFENYALTRVEELTNIYERERTGGLPERARMFADHWMERQADAPEFVIAALEFFVHALRKPELRDALATRQAAVRLALARMLEQDVREAGLGLPLPADELATVLRELGVGLALAKLADPEVARDGLYGDFVELFFGLLTAGAGTSWPDLGEKP